jgi:hypothetical protein
MMVALRTEAENNGHTPIRHSQVASARGGSPAVRSSNGNGRPKPRRRRRASSTQRLFSIFRPEGMPEEPLPFVRKNTLPDHYTYHDTGCELAPSCLACPLPRCQYDEPHSVRAWLVAARDREIVLLRRRYHAPINALARTYGLTRRSVFRILQEHGGRDDR